MHPYQHQEFLSLNKIPVDDLPPGIQKKIYLFNKMAAVLEDIIDDDRHDLETKLDKLDLEIQEDIEEQYELDNDELEEHDEDILEEFYKRNKPVTLSELRKAGFKGDWTKPHGDFWLKRGSFLAYRFTVMKKSKTK